MILPNKIKKISTLLNILNEHIDLSMFYLNVYRIRDNFHRLLPGTYIDIRAFGTNPITPPIVSYCVVEGIDCKVEIPDYLLRKVTSNEVQLNNWAMLPR